MKYATNDKVITPNGKGIVQGKMFVDGQHWVLVRHTLSDMTSSAAGVCETPHAHISGLWRYDAKEITQYEGHESD